MKELPEADIYEEGLEYWPYKKSLATVLKLACANTKNGGSLLDIMCGPGYLLEQLWGQRPDLELVGVDNDDRYIRHGKLHHPNATFWYGDVRRWEFQKNFDTVLCTGALHHVPYEDQEAAVKNIASLVKSDGVVIISDCYVDPFQTEIERKLAAAKLGYEYLIATIKNGAPDDVISWTVDILSNDVGMAEFKTSLTERVVILGKYFKEVRTTKIWPESESGYGDYIHICTPE